MRRTIVLPFTGLLLLHCLPSKLELDSSLTDAGSAEAPLGGRSGGGTDSSGGRLVEGGVGSDTGSGGAQAQGAASSGGSGVAGEATDSGGNSPSSEAGRGSGDMSTAGVGGGADAEVALCDRYCAAVLASCTGQFEQYESLRQCVEVCKRLPEGQPGDRSGNTVECRLYQAQFAESEPLVYCKNAGPLAEGKCGSNCVGFCTLMQALCTHESTGGNVEPSYFATESACLAACDEITPGPEAPTKYSSSSSAQPPSYVGNSVYCRTYHVALGLELSSPDEHCPHAMGGDPCTD